MSISIPKSIEILADIITYVKPGDPPDEHDAICLGIQALKRVKTNRTLPYPIISKPLPGEAKD